MKGRWKMKSNYQENFLTDLYATMFRIREFEEQVFELYKIGLMPGLAHLYIGEEAIATGACATLEDKDYIGSTHRGHGHLIARGADTKKMMAEILGKKDGYCKGKAGSMHIMTLDKGILGANGVVGGGIPIATGAAYKAKIKDTKQVTICLMAATYPPGPPPMTAISKFSIFSLLSDDYAKRLFQ